MKILKDKNEVIELRKDHLLSDLPATTRPIDGLRSITINPTELCNRKCHFCPRVDPKVYPNQKLHISPETIKNLSKKLKDIEYTGGVIWSGNGEPLLTRNLLEMTKHLRDENPQMKRQEINTNGDYLRPKKIEEVYNSGIDYIIVSLYDGPEQLEKFQKRFEQYDKSMYSLRISYYHSDNFENFSNRAGAININMDKFKTHKNNKCYFPFYKLFLDWNGDVLLCCEDWFKLSKKFNEKLNINTHTLEEIWDSNFLNTYRSRLKVGDRSSSPCNKCNMNGEKIGKEFVSYYNV